MTYADKKKEMEELGLLDNGGKPVPESLVPRELPQPMDFGGALVALKRRFRVARAGWNGAGQFLELQVPDEHSKMGLPYIYITTVQGKRVPWTPSQTDVLADDWTVCPPSDA